MIKRFCWRCFWVTIILLGVSLTAYAAGDVASSGQWVDAKTVIVALLGAAMSAIGLYVRKLDKDLDKKAPASSVERVEREYLALTQSMSELRRDFGEHQLLLARQYIDKNAVRDVVAAVVAPLDAKLDLIEDHLIQKKGK